MIEVFRRTPAARIQSNAGDAHLKSQLDALLGVLNVAFAGSCIWRDKVLVNGQANEIYTIQKSVPLKLPEVFGVFRVHLPMQDIDTLHSKAGGLVDDRLDGNLRRSKVPVRITGNAEFDPSTKLDRRLGVQALKRRDYGQGQGGLEKTTSLQTVHESNL